MPCSAPQQPGSSALSRDADVVARYVGDEFVVVYEGADDNAVRGLIERIHDSLSAPFDIGGNVTVHCAVSIGIADTRSTDPNASALIGAADRAMLDAKKQPGPPPPHATQPDSDGQGWSTMVDPGRLVN